jgi:hypothetical protein
MLRSRAACAVLGTIVSGAAVMRCSAQPQADDSLVIIHTNVIEGISNAPVVDTSVVVTNGRI